MYRPVEQLKIGDVLEIAGRSGRQYLVYREHTVCNVGAGHNDKGTPSYVVNLKPLAHAGTYDDQAEPIALSDNVRGVRKEYLIGGYKVVRTMRQDFVQD